MAHGGNFGLDEVPWFNGGLFDASHLLPLEQNALRLLREVAELDWSAIEPSILGTLFERGLDPAKRAQLGAHYTDPAAIQRLLNPVIFHPLHRAWEHDKTHINHLLDSAQHAKSAAAKRKHHAAATATLQAFLERLRAYRILDPACGSGNFLLLALKGLKDLEHQVLLEAEALGLGRYFPAVGPENVLGIELNPYAAELARVTVWIGEIQWMLAHGFSLAMNPILRPLHTIDQRDALLNDDGTEAPWPSADAIVGNPPFLGGSKKRGLLGDDYFHALERVYAGRVPGGADLVTYWFEKARAQLANGHAHAAGLVATQSIRAGANRKVLERIVQSGKIFEAWSDEPWVNEGAAVRVSLVGFGRMEDHADAQLNGQKVEHIYPDLTGSEAGGEDLTQKKLLAENANSAFKGPEKSGAFDIPGDLARQWLGLPNPNNRPNSDILKPWVNGKDIAGRLTDTWVIDFGVDTNEEDASLYEAPFQHILQHVKPQRQNSRDNGRQRYWWRFGRNGADFRGATKGLQRFLVTPRVAKHRYFVWLSSVVSSDSRLLVIAREDDTTFGILSSRIHQVWALANASRHGDGNEGGRPTYNAKSCFETYPFPNGLTPADTGQGTYTLESGAIVPHVAPEVSDHARAIAQAAHRLNTLRDNWLNPPNGPNASPKSTPATPNASSLNPDTKPTSNNAPSPTSTTNAPPGSKTPTKPSTTPSPPPTAGPTTPSPKPTSSPTSSPSTAAANRERGA
nr:DNA methyltransferase [Thiorhodospira sibirica]